MIRYMWNTDPEYQSLVLATAQAKNELQGIVEQIVLRVDTLNTKPDKTLVDLIEAEEKATEQYGLCLKACSERAQEIVKRLIQEQGNP